MDSILSFLNLDTLSALTRTEWGKSKSTVVKQFILVLLLFIHYCIIFRMNNCHATFAPLCVEMGPQWQVEEIYIFLWQKVWLFYASKQSQIQKWWCKGVKVVSTSQQTNPVTLWLLEDYFHRSHIFVRGKLIARLKFLKSL